MKNDMEKRLAAIQDKTNQFAIIVDVFASSLNPPIIYDSGIQHWGFRYAKPTAKHFCMLKAARAISGINASVVLAKAGFPQEICVLIRTVIECLSHIEFIIAGIKDEKLEARQQEIVDKFFEDYRRNSSSDFLGPTIRQKEVHDIIDRFFEDVGATGEGGQFASVSLGSLMSNIYRNFSNYVHARYPESMDMYGGAPPYFHMKGMSGTPKDTENLLIIENFTNSVALVLALMIQKFDMKRSLIKVPELAGWFKQGDKIQA